MIYLLIEIKRMKENLFKKENVEIKAIRCEKKEYTIYHALNMVLKRYIPIVLRGGNNKVYRFN